MNSYKNIVLTFSWHLVIKGNSCTASTIRYPTVSFAVDKVLTKENKKKTQVPSLLRLTAYGLVTALQTPAIHLQKWQSTYFATRSEIRWPLFLCHRDQRIHQYYMSIAFVLLGTSQKHGTHCNIHYTYSMELRFCWLGSELLLQQFTADH